MENPAFSLAAIPTNEDLRCFDIDRTACVYN